MEMHIFNSPVSVTSTPPLSWNPHPWEMIGILYFDNTLTCIGDYPALRPDVWPVMLMSNGAHFQQMVLCCAHGQGQLGVSVWLAGSIIWRRASPFTLRLPFSPLLSTSFARIPFLGVKGHSLGCPSIPDSTHKHTQSVCEGYNRHWTLPGGCEGRRGLTATISL